MEEFLQKARALYPGLPDSFINLYAQYWEDTGDAQQAISQTRQDPQYDTIFPGNKTERGQIRYDEVTYFALEDSYIGTLAEYGIPRQTSLNILQDRFVNLLENEVSATEFRQRVASVYQGIQQNMYQLLPTNDCSRNSPRASPYGSTTEYDDRVVLEWYSVCLC